MSFLSQKAMQVRDRQVRLIVNFMLAVGADVRSIKL